MLRAGSKVVSWELGGTLRGAAGEDMGPGSLRAAGDASSLRLLLFWDSHPAHPQGHPWRRLQTWVRSCHHLPHQWPRMCWQQLPALLAPLGIPHTLGTLAMPPAWGQPWAPPLRGWGPAVGAQPPTLLPAMLWGCIPLLAPSDASLRTLLVADHLPAPGEGRGPLAAPSPCPQPRGVQECLRLESHAWLGLPGNWET